MIYIGSPYFDPSPYIRDARARDVGLFAATCIKDSHIVYCPIASWHHLVVEHNLPGNFQFWRRLNLGILRYCSEIWVLDLEGWQMSVGLAGEIQRALEWEIVIRHFDGETFLEVLE